MTIPNRIVLRRLIATWEHQQAKQWAARAAVIARQLAEMRAKP